MNARATTFEDASLRATAARATLRLFILWVTVEVVGLFTTMYFGWDGVLQPVVAAGLILRFATLGAWVTRFKDAFPGAPRAAQRAFGAGIVALALSLLLVVDLAPASFTEAGWDAVSGLFLTISLLAVPLLAVFALQRSSLALRVTSPTALYRAIPVVAALVFGALLRVVSPALTPSPWIGPVAAGLLALFLGLSHVTPVWTVALALAALGTSAVVFGATPETRTFVAAPAVVALVVAGLAVVRALKAHAQALTFMAQALATRDLPEPADPGDASLQTRPEQLSEDEALALVDQELGLSPEKRPVIEISTAEAEAIRAPFQLKQDAPPQNDSTAIAGSAKWTTLGNVTGRLGVAYIVFTVGALFGAFLSLTPFGDHFLGRITAHTALASFFAFQGWLAHRARRDGPSVGSALSAQAPTFVALVAAVAFALGAFVVGPAAGPLSAVGGAAGWVLLALTLLRLRSFAGAIAASKLVLRLDNLIKLTLSLGLVGTMTALHGALAPGDIAWLGSPLRVGTGILALGVMLMLAYVLHDAKQHFEDQGIHLRRVRPSPTLDRQR